MIGEEHGELADLEPTASAGLGESEALLDRAYKEFCAGRAAGQDISPESYCARFPAIRDQLERLLLMHAFLEDHPALLGEPENLRWPKDGERFLDFQLKKELGRGSFARVYLASVPKLGGRLAALKVTWQSGAEARVLGPLQHPNIVSVQSVDADPDSPLTAICMPYLGSATLRDAVEKLRHLPAPPERARIFLDCAAELAHPLDLPALPLVPSRILQNGAFGDGIRFLAMQLADALAFLHQRGIVHYDLKPSNILLTPDGTPMLLDFNLSASSRPLAQRWGTLCYNSPELLNGQIEHAAGAPCDIFSLGVILFELATGAHPFGPIPQNADAAELGMLLGDRIRAGAPDPCRLNRRLEKSLGRLIQSCLAQDPRERPAAPAIARRLRGELKGVARAERLVARHPKIAAAVLCLLAALGIASAAGYATREPFAKRQMDAGLALQQKGRFADAVAHFSTILEGDPCDTEALLARAQAYQQWAATDERYYRSALADFHEADRLAPSGRAKAGAGYCLNKTDADPRFAIASYEAARDFGFESAALFNNLGCAQLKLAQLEKAEANLSRAIELDRRLGVAYQNRASVRLLAALALAKSRPQAGLQENDKRVNTLARTLGAAISDVDRAIELGPVSAELYFDAAHLHALAAAADPNHDKAALALLQKAIDSKLDPRRLATDPCFDRLRGDANFQKLQNATPPSEPAPRAVRYIDPLR